MAAYQNKEILNKKNRILNVNVNKKFLNTDGPIYEEALIFGECCTNNSIQQYDQQQRFSRIEFQEAREFIVTLT